jgi:hypothetical protein
MTLDDARERIVDVFRQVDARDPGDNIILLVQVIEHLSANHYLRQDAFLKMLQGHVIQMLEQPR